jgi:hypothetical protein
MNVAAAVFFVKPLTRRTSKRERPPAQEGVSLVVQLR